MRVTSKIEEVGSGDDDISMDATTDNEDVRTHDGFEEDMGCLGNGVGSPNHQQGMTCTSYAVATVLVPVLCLVPMKSIPFRSPGFPVATVGAAAPVACAPGPAAGAAAAAAAAPAKAHPRPPAEHPPVALPRPKTNWRYLQKQEDKFRIHVSKMRKTAKQEILEEHLEKHGCYVKGTEWVMDGKRLRFAFVDLQDSVSFEKALALGKTDVDHPKLGRPCIARATPKPLPRQHNEHQPHP